jgi:hypothetical protein
MLRRVCLSLFSLILVFAGITLGAPVILNEYNAVDDAEYLGAEQPWLMKPAEELLISISAEWLAMAETGLN